MFFILLVLSCLTIIAGYLMYFKNSTIQHKEKVQEDVRVSIIIPARDEENNLPTLLESIKSQSLKPYDIIVADDASTDRTTEIAHSFGAIVQNIQKKEGWIGKTFGCWEGAKVASGNLLLFIDADTWFPDSKSLEKVVSTYQKRGLRGLLSVQPYHAIQKAYENFSIIFNIFVIVGMNIFSINGAKINKPGGFGPFLLTSKENYFQVGGHKAVKSSLIEGLALGEKFQENRLPLHLYSGKNTVHFRMYPEGIRQLMNGWTKHFATGSKNTHFIVMIWISCWIAGGFLIPAFLILTILQQTILWILLASLCYVAYFLQFYFFAQRTGKFSLWAALLYPIIFLFFIGVFTRSWLATNIFKSVEWKGQKIDL